MRVPELYTARFFATSVLGFGEVVPVDVAYRPPTMELGYLLEERMEVLAPLPEHLGEFAPLAYGMRCRWERAGAEEIARQLSAISERHGGKPLALCCHEDVARGIEECTRIVFSQWWADTTGYVIHELTDDAEMIPWDRLPKQVIPPRRRAVQPVLAEPIALYPWTREHFG